MYTWPMAPCKLLGVQALQVVLGKRIRMGHAASVVRQKFLNNRRLLTVWQQLYQPRPGAPSDRCLRREASFLPSL
jgi:hypothetical protein